MRTYLSNDRCRSHVPKNHLSIARDLTGFIGRVPS